MDMAVAEKQVMFVDQGHAALEQGNYADAIAAAEAGIKDIMEYPDQLPGLITILDVIATQSRETGNYMRSYRAATLMVRAGIETTEDRRLAATHLRSTEAAARQAGVPESEIRIIAGQAKRVEGLLPDMPKPEAAVAAETPSVLTALGGSHVSSFAPLSSRP